MNPDYGALIIAGVGLVLSWGGSLFIAGTRWGTVNTRLAVLERSMTDMATKDQLAGIKEDVAEIKGMFRMTLRDGPDGR